MGMRSYVNTSKIYRDGGHIIDHVVEAFATHLSKIECIQMGCNESGLLAIRATLYGSNIIRTK